MASFGLIRSFGIDDGELDGVSPQQCFVLGYELAQIDEAAKQAAAIDRPVHAANKRRIEEAFAKVNRPFSLTWMAGDSSESWMVLKSIELKGVVQ